MIAQVVEEVYVSDPSIYYSLGEILKKEMDEGTSRKPGSCSKSIAWLTRYPKNIMWMLFFFIF